MTNILKISINIFNYKNHKNHIIFFFNTEVIFNTVIKHIVNVIIGTIWDKDESPFGIKAIPLSEIKFYFNLYIFWSSLLFDPQEILAFSIECNGTLVIFSREGWGYLKCIGCEYEYYRTPDYLSSVNGILYL